MASGKNHDKIGIFTTPVAFFAGTYLLGLKLGLIVGISYFVGIWWLSPDLDLKSRPWRRWSLLRIIWIPYQVLIPHRHPLSHWIVLGTLVRITYLVVMVGAIVIVIGNLLSVPQFVTGSVYSLVIKWVVINTHLILAMLAGLEGSAWCHLFLDGLIIPLPPSIKRRLKGE